MTQICSATCLLFIAAICCEPVLSDSSRRLEYAPAPVDNPLKGLVPYQADVRDFFPHSLEFNYLPYSALVNDYNEYAWEPIEKMLDDIAGRGHQAVLRIFLEYPGKKNVIPEFLLRDGLKVTKWKYTETQPLPPASIETPDYENENLRKSLKNFLAAFGKKYDGDPRIGFITAGLLGTWGEWHCYPREELFASKTVQREVMDAYEAAFKVTPVLLRYPIGEMDEVKAMNANRPFGYHDDSFAWATLHTGKSGDEWFYMTALQIAGPQAEAKWKSHPIGGEIRPEAWSRVFDDDPGIPSVQSFRECVETTHATWLMDSGMFQKKQSDDRIARAEEQVRRMGYEFHANSVTIGELKNRKLEVQLEIENRGVAPFYYDWAPEYGLLIEGQSVKTWVGSGRLTDLLPSDKPRIWSDTFDLSGVIAGRYTLAVRVPNSLKTGKPLRFANETQDVASSGWMSLGLIVVPK